MKKMIKMTALALLCLCFLPSQARAATQLIPGGEVVGLELQDGTVTVAAFDEELGSVCQKAGIEVGDVIEKVDGVQIHTADDIEHRGFATARRTEDRPEFVGAEAQAYTAERVDCRVTRYVLLGNLF